MTVCSLGSKSPFAPRKSGFFRGAKDNIIRFFRRAKDDIYGSFAERKATEGLLAAISDMKYVTLPPASAVDRLSISSQNRTETGRGNVRNEHLSRIETLWSVVRQAHAADSAATSSARAQLIERYGDAIRRYLMACLRDSDAVDEVFQEFSLRFVRGEFASVSPEKGRFRSYIKPSSTIWLQTLAAEKNATQPRRSNTKACWPKTGLMNPVTSTNSFRKAGGIACSTGPGSICRGTKSPAENLGLPCCKHELTTRNSGHRNSPNWFRRRPP